MKKYNNEIIIFVVNAIGMILELIASRLLSPYFGNSNIVWTSVIGIILLSGSIGNYLGGKIADREDKQTNLKIILIGISLFIFLIPFTQTSIIKSIIKYINSVKIGAIISTILLFFIPSLCMGIVTPIILKLKLESLDTAGKVSGNITAIATIGGILGTFIGGFVLIPNIGSTNILFILNILIVLLIPLVNNKIREISSLYVIFMIIISLISFYYFSTKNINNQENILDGDYNKIASFDTQYGRVLIYNSKSKDNENIRFLNIDSGFESATFTDEDKVNELVFDYTKYYDLMFKANIEINDVLLIGGAGYSYPKYYISHYLDKRMDVVEIDEKITEIAKKYFYLDKLFKDYNLDSNKRLNLINNDGRIFLNNTDKKYDAILNDAFSGKSPAKTLTTLENIRNIKKSLNNNGLYLTNIISSLDGNNSKFIKAEVNTLKQVFNNVYIVPCSKPDNIYDTQNIMVIATDDDLILENSASINISEDEIILTDDFCPIDTLIPQES